MVSKRSSNRDELTVPKQLVQKKTYAWHSHDYREVLSLIGSTESGLELEEVIERQKKFGKNTFSEAHTQNILMRIVAQLRSPLAFVLVLAFLVTAALEEYLDASVILFALVIAVVVGILQEGRASGAFKKLSDSQVRKAVVIRGGKKHEINAEEDLGMI